MNDLLPENVSLSQLRLQLLGPPRVVLDGQLITGFKSVKAQALLYYLAGTRRPRSRAEVAAMFWPDVNEQRAKTSLRTVLSNLRRLFGRHLEISRRTVNLDPRSNISIDVAQFDTLLKRGVGEAPDILQVETAVSLYSGDFLEGFQLPDAPLFEQWATAEATRLRGSLLGALHTLAMWHAERSEYQTSLDYLARLLAIDPIREVGHRLKMAVLALSGQRGAALAYFDVSRRIRSEQVGLDPTPETTALYELILHDKFPGEGQPAISELIADTQSRGMDSSTAVDLKRPTTFRQDQTRKTANFDLGAMPGRTDLYGRRHQISQVVQWLLAEECHLVAIVGIGGVGKTTLAAEATRLIASSSRERLSNLIANVGTKTSQIPPFDQIIWRSLVNRPPMTAILNDWLQILPASKLSELPDTLEAKLSILNTELKRQRCLLILDNAESVLQDEVSEEQEVSILEAYQHLIRPFVNTDHQSCLLLTSREIPPIVRQRAEADPETKLLQLDGLPPTAGAELLRSQGLDIALEKLESIVQRYSGNPLALKLVADTVWELFAGDVEELLHDETVIFGDIREVLDQQYERLSGLEQEILNWLAIEREPIPTQVLWDNLSNKPHRRQFLEALRSLQQRSLVEQPAVLDESAAPQFALQNVVMEYLTSRLVESVCQELESGELEFLQRFALIKAHTKEYVENSQRRLLLQPVSAWLSARLGTAGAVNRLREWLEALQGGPPQMPGYAGANILHLLISMDVDLSGYDFSDLAIWQADLRNTSLYDVSFKGADLKGSLFRDTFGLVAAIAVSSDGRLIAAGGSDGSISLWGLNEYQTYQFLKAHSEPATCIAFSRDGRYLASAAYDRTIRLWEVESGKMLRELSGHSAPATAVIFSPDGGKLFTASIDGTVGVWTTQDGQLQQQLQDSEDNLLALDLSLDGKLLASGGHDGFVYMWDAGTGQLKNKIRGHDRKIQSVAFSPDGDILATAGEDNQINLWQVVNGRLLGTLRGHANWVLSVAFSPDGRQLASGSADKTIRLWDVYSSQTIRVLRSYKNWVTSVAFSPDGALVAGGSYDRRIRLWDVKSGWLVHTLRGSLRWVDQITYSPDGSMLASTVFDKPLLLWDVESGKLLKRLRGHSSSLRSCFFSPDGRIVASGSDDHTIRLWETASGKIIKTFTGHEGFVRTIAFSPDGQFLAAGDMAGRLRLWEISTGRIRYEWPSTRMGVKFSLGFSPDGRHLAFGRLDHSISIIDAATGEEQASLKGHEAQIRLVRFSPDGSLLASSAKDGTIRIWKLADDDSKKWITFRQWSVSSEDLWNLVFSPNGKLVASQIDESTIGVWNIEEGHLGCSFNQHLFGESCLDFSLDGKFLITGSADGAICMWRASSGKLHRIMKGHAGSLTSLAVSPDGDYISSCSTGGTIRIWELKSGESRRTITPPGPYAGMDITSAAGLTPSQAAALRALGAVDDRRSADGITATSGS